MSETKEKEQLKDEEKTFLKREKVDYDTFLSAAGELGWYQILLVLATGPFHFFGICVYFSQLFMAELPPEHWCRTPELANLTQLERRNLSIPADPDSRFGYSQCHMYDANWTEVLASGLMPNHTSIVPCQYGWEFDRSKIPYPTISSDFEWVCDKKSYQATAQAIFFAGSVFGGMFIGWVADRFGRVPATIASNMLGCVGGFTSTFVRSFMEFAACRFVMGMAYNTCQMIPYLIVLEYTAPRYRSLFANTSLAIFCALFSTIFPYIALASGHWKTLSLVSSVPLALVLLAPLILPESPRWLLSKGRVDDVVVRIQSIAKINRKQIPPKLIEQFKESIEIEEELSIVEIFKRPLLRKNYMLVCLNYMLCLVIFDNLYRNLTLIEFDFFHSVAVTSSTEFPSGMLTAFILDVLGRRLVACSMLLITGATAVCLIFIKTAVPSLICAIAARFSSNIALNTTTQWSAELLPTSVRGSGVSFLFSCGNFAVILSPYITYLKFVYVWLPYMVLVCLSLIGGAVTFILPETAKRVMPHTFDDAEKLAKSHKFWETPWKATEKDTTYSEVKQQEYELEDYSKKIKN